MPYSKKSNYRKRNYRKRGYRKMTPWYAKWLMKSGSVQEMAKAGLSGFLAVKSLLNTEKKFLDTTGTGYNCDTTPTLVHLTNIIRGDDYNNRSGRQVKLTKLSGKLHLACNPINGYDTVRICIVQLKQSAVPAVSDIFTSNTVQSFRNLNNIRDIRMLYDKTVSLDTDNNTLELVNINMNLNDKCQWQVGTDNGEWGHIYMFVLGGYATASNPSHVDYSFRVRYVDN